ncbi:MULTISPECIES: VWA domain-containing protein [Rhizobium]|uniref:VWA domain-containing protein n=1 Tax=Rhizobium sophoriradicis TaxID=1535245 RepID=A0A2A5KXL2_9HYPH|nr:MULTISPECIES: VWA domain-containing protein [Rhizobium]ARQ61509.1 von Willebrand factor A domain-containing CoxE-like protein [Rhizobium sp. Kim5]PCK81705.1 VWA domain-containing protein [Rhizobium sophoriradicis]PCK86913.1 VWA domain-containing protein [Rhizobium sophoriradicis]RSB91964.1 VWA domain-containing protein [Rhizobium sophoriradicis]
MTSERIRRWKLALGDDDMEGLGERDQRLSRALSVLYESEGRKGRGGLGASSPKVSRWLGDIREFFPSPVVQVIQKDAFERLNLKALMLEPEFLETLEADVHLVADLISLRGAMPAKTMETARAVVNKVVEDLMKRLQSKTVEKVTGALNRSQRTHRPRHADIDWPRTIRANLRHYQEDFHTIVPETLVGFARKSRTQADLDHVMLCVDQSGSMASSVVYASIFAAVMASLPVLSTKLVCFDTAIVDLTEDLADPVKVLFGVQLGGGTDINAALAYCETKIDRPNKTHLVLITDLYEGGDAGSMLARVAALKQSGVNVIVLLALSDDGRPGYDARHAGAIAAMDCPVFACTPDQFPDLMAVALTKQDIGQWASANGIGLVRGT